ncbi:MAG: thioredoxin, partial [Bacteroidota bacterium]
IKFNIMKEIRNLQEYKQLIEQGKPVLLDFYADWCGPCQVLLPTVERLADKYDGEINIAKVNVDENRDLAMQFGIRSIPALFFLKNGKIDKNLLGVQSEATLEKEIQAYTVAV